MSERVPVPTLKSPPARRLERLARAAAVVMREPAEGVERIREKIADEGARWTKSSSLAPDGDWPASLHAMLGVEWTCQEVTGFDPLWNEVVAGLRGKGLSVGRGSFSGWDDGDAGLARAAWCVTRHQRPEIVVETGVARGLTTRVLLEALEANGFGRLYSIDLPPPLAQERLVNERAAAVTAELRTRWTLIEGSSRRRLPGLLRELGTIDVFVHDSRHTRRNISFELCAAWSALRPGGVMLADDIHGTIAFEESIGAFGNPPAIVCSSDDQRGRFGLIKKPG
ncbi:MAG: class I SAM-dependent methyltransferase [Solirubrobacterales bacterium]|nr:class I SAM-dependent methyltransferase [Solirubrobacterales bacterium]